MRRVTSEKYLINMEPLDSFCNLFKHDMDPESHTIIKETLRLNGFTSELSLKLLDIEKSKELLNDSGVKQGPLIVFEHFVANKINETPKSDQQNHVLNDQSSLHMFEAEAKELDMKITERKEHLANLKATLQRKTAPVDPIKR